MVVFVNNENVIKNSAIASVFTSLGKMKEAWVWLAASCFFAVEVACINSQFIKIITVLLALCALSLVIIIIAFRYKPRLLFSLPIYGIIAVEVTIGLGVIRWLSIAVIFLLPIIYAFCKTSSCEIRFPQKIPIILIVTGFFISFINKLWTATPWAFSKTPYYDILFGAGIAVYCSIFLLLVKKSISLISTVKAMALSGLPFIALLFYHYLLAHALPMIFKERLGNSIGIHPNFISMFIEMLLPLALFLGLAEQNKRKQTFYFCCSALYFLCIFGCNARGSIFGLFALLFFLVFTTKNLKIRLLFIAVLIAVLMVFGEAYSHRMLHPNLRDLESNAGRIELLRASIKVLKNNNYIFGIGMNQFALDKYHYGFPAGLDLARAMSSHNQFIEVWLGWGIIAFAGWILLLAGTGVRLIRTRLPHSLSLIKAGLLFSLFFSFTHSLVDSFVASPELMLYIFIPLACCEYLIKYKSI